MTDAALYLLLGTSIVMSVLLTWSTFRVWRAVDAVLTAAEVLGAQATLLAAQAQANTAHAALLSGSVDTLRRDLANRLVVPDDLVHGLNYPFLEGDD